MQAVAWVIYDDYVCSSCCCSLGYKKFVGRRSLEKLYDAAQKMCRVKPMSTKPCILE